MAFLSRARRVSTRTLAVAAVATAFIFAGSQAAFANSFPHVNPGNVPTTAANFSQECGGFAGSAQAGFDTWVFVLPDFNQAGNWVSITAEFSGQSDVTVTFAASPGNFVNNGPQAAKAKVVTPAGWTLTGAHGEITGTANQNQFELTHTCKSSTTPSPSGSPSGTPSETPSGTPSETPSGTPSGSPSPSSSTSGSETPSASTSPSTPSLPTTGSSLTGVLVTGVVLLLAGAGIFFAARRRRTTA